MSQVNLRADRASDDEKASKKVMLCKKYYQIGQVAEFEISSTPSQVTP